ncbi:hypothetical protein GGP41_007175 [Bipolaris sorokiniana]|uniref:Uncharacterized protein n=1 Tax=Cochliobolus sativus TaxID=45130 RepID=A0A8H6DZT2_COCSA|nr:hypothetical protein GGP41_007175 [Bipolaris sorokiniana]
MPPLRILAEAHHQHSTKSLLNNKNPAWRTARQCAVMCGLSLSSMLMRALVRADFLCMRSLLGLDLVFGSILQGQWWADKKESNARSVSRSSKNDSLN